MRHRVAGRRLGRSTGHRRSLFRNLVTELFRHERIQTTEAKAKAVRAQAEKLITVAKRAKVVEGREVTARRRLSASLNDADIAKKVYDDLAERFESRPGGYTRILKLGPRKGDGARMVLLELVDRP
ncbi:MAG TPA: 50S ribosomal protein L17 [Anaerolineae bacterium]|nr:50S ribosomal protein L17 [Anaerolineae bacterium]